jgi:membrane associated rhomboid family serine protease
MTLPMPSPTSQPAKKERSLLPAQIKPAVVTVGGLAVVMLVVQIINVATNYSLIHWGIESRDLSGLWGVLFAPLIHGSWGHLFGNMIPFLIFGLLLFVGGVRQFVAVTVVVWLVSGLGVWLIGPSNAYTVGASGLIFGWLAYLVARGVFTKNWGQLAIGLVLLILYGGMFWTGIFHTAFFGSGGISWQGHLFGAIGGLLAAFLVARANKPQQKTPAPGALPPGGLQLG